MERQQMMSKLLVFRKKPRKLGTKFDMILIHLTLTCIVLSYRYYSVMKVRVCVSRSVR